MHLVSELTQSYTLPVIMSPCQIFDMTFQSIPIYAQKQLLGGWHSVDGGLIQKALRDPTKAAHRQALLKVFSQALGIAGGVGGQKFDPQALREMEVSLTLHFNSLFHSNHILEFSVHG